MSTQGNLDLIQSFYEAFGRGDVASIIEGVGDGADWSVEAASDAAPWYGQYGKDTLSEFFAALAEAVTVEEFTPLSMIAGDDAVASLIRFRFRSNATGQQAEMQIHHFWRIRDGKAVYFRGSEDTAQTLATIGG